MAPSDVEPVAEIEQESVSPWSPAQITEELSCSCSVTLVVENEEGIICAWCCARYLGEEAELLKIAVHRNIRRIGLGADLLSSLQQLLTQLGVVEIFLEVRSKNEPALRLYQKNGFKVVGKRPGYYSNPTDDALICQFHTSHGVIIGKEKKNEIVARY